MNEERDKRDEQEPKEITINLGEVARDLRSGLRNYNRKYKVTGGQWAMFFAGILAFYLAFSAEGGFNAFVFFFWLLVFAVILAPFRVASWTQRRMNSRPCAVCGERIPNGETVCSSCGTDFRNR